MSIRDEIEGDLKEILSTNEIGEKVILEIDDGRLEIEGVFLESHGSFEIPQGLEMETQGPTLTIETNYISGVISRDIRVILRGKYWRVLSQKENGFGLSTLYLSETR